MFAAKNNLCSPSANQVLGTWPGIESCCDGFNNDAEGHCRPRGLVRPLEGASNPVSYETRANRGQATTNAPQAGNSSMACHSKVVAGVALRSNSATPFKAK